MAKAKKEAKKTSLELELPIYYQSTTKYSGQKFQVSLIEINGSMATVKTQGSVKETFNCRLSSMFN